MLTKKDALAVLNEHVSRFNNSRGTQVNHDMIFRLQVSSSMHPYKLYRA